MRKSGPQIYTTDAIEGWQGGAVGQGWLSDLEGDELIAHLQNPNRQDVNNLKAKYSAGCENRQSSLGGVGFTG